jgi:hypothetical protein
MRRGCSTLTTRSVAAQPAPVADLPRPQERIFKKLMLLMMVVRIGERFGVPAVVVIADGRERNIRPVPAKRLSVHIGAKPAGWAGCLRRPVGFRGHGQFGTQSQMRERAAQGRGKRTYPSDDRHEQMSPQGKRDPDTALSRHPGSLLHRYSDMRRVTLFDEPVEPRQKGARLVLPEDVRLARPTIARIVVSS